MIELDMVENEIEILEGQVDEDYFFVSRKEWLSFVP